MVRLVSVDADDEPVSDDTDVVAVDPTRSEVAVSGSLGAQMLLWEVAVAAAGRLLGINPFDQPDVESAKAAARELLDKGLGAAAAPAATDGAIEIRTMGGDGTGSAAPRPWPAPWTRCSPSSTRTRATSP